jgi:hypothetical protein
VLYLALLYDHNESLLFWTDEKDVYQIEYIEYILRLRNKKKMVLDTVVHTCNPNTW